MKNCWINLLAVYNILEEAFDKGMIDKFAKDMLEIELDGLDFFAVMGHGKDCKYFDYESVAKVHGIPLIVAHERCSKWGDGCKTTENGYCFLFEQKESEERR